MNELPPEQARRIAEAIITALAFALGGYVFWRWVFG